MPLARFTFRPPVLLVTTWNNICVLRTCDILRRCVDCWSYKAPIVVKSMGRHWRKPRKTRESWIQVATTLVDKFKDTLVVLYRGAIANDRFHYVKISLAASNYVLSWFDRPIIHSRDIKNTVKRTLSCFKSYPTVLQQVSVNYRNSSVCQCTAGYEFKLSAYLSD